MYLYTLKQQTKQNEKRSTVVNRFKKNVSLHVETTQPHDAARQFQLWIALKKMYLYTLKQLIKPSKGTRNVVNRFKKNVSLHVETTQKKQKKMKKRCESL